MFLQNKLIDKVEEALEEIKLYTKDKNIIVVVGAPLRYLSNSPLQVEIKLIQTKTYTCHNTPEEHLKKFYGYSS